MQIFSIKTDIKKNQNPAFGMDYANLRTGSYIRSAVLDRIITAAEEQAIKTSSPRCSVDIVLFDKGGGFLKVIGPQIKYECSHNDLPALFDALIRTFTSCRSSANQIPQAGRLIDIKV